MGGLLCSLHYRLQFVNFHDCPRWFLAAHRSNNSACGQIELSLTVMSASLRPLLNSPICLAQNFLR